MALWLNFLCQSHESGNLRPSSQKWKSWKFTTIPAPVDFLAKTNSGSHWLLSRRAAFQKVTCQALHQHAVFVSLDAARRALAWAFNLASASAKPPGIAPPHANCPLVTLAKRGWPLGGEGKGIRLMGAVSMALMKKRCYTFSGTCPEVLAELEKLEASDKAAEQGARKVSRLGCQAVVLGALTLGAFCVGPVLLWMAFKKPKPDLGKEFNWILSPVTLILVWLSAAMLFYQSTFFLPEFANPVILFFVGIPALFVGVFSAQAIDRAYNLDDVRYRAAADYLRLIQADLNNKRRVKVGLNLEPMAAWRPPGGDKSNDKEWLRVRFAADEGRGVRLTVTRKFRSRRKRRSIKYRYRDLVDIRLSGASAVPEFRPASGLDQAGLMRLEVSNGPSFVRVRFETAVVRIRVRPNLVNQPPTVIGPAEITGSKLVLGTLTAFAAASHSRNPSQP